MTTEVMRRAPTALAAPPPHQTLIPSQPPIKTPPFDSPPVSFLPVRAPFSQPRPAYYLLTGQTQNKGIQHAPFRIERPVSHLVYPWTLPPVNFYYAQCLGTPRSLGYSTPASPIQGHRFTPVFKLTWSISLNPVGNCFSFPPGVQMWPIFANDPLRSVPDESISNSNSQPPYLYT